MRHIDDQLFDLYESARQHVSVIKPSNWVEANRIMTREITQYPGPFRYDRTPYSREIIDRFSPDDPAHTIVVEKGIQLGLTAGVIEGAVGWIIDQCPGSIMLLSGNADLSKELIDTRVDQMIDHSGLRHKIRPNALRKRNQRTGDTSTSKEFEGGFLVAGTANNPDMLRQRSIRYILVDDFDAMKKNTKQTGDIRTLIENRAASYKNTKKILYISSPELKSESNIEPVYLLGDQRRYMVACPCCHVYIELKWEFRVNEKDIAGITWKLDNHGRLVPESVGYICQECGNFFDDRPKLEMLQHGFWQPTTEPSEIGYYSYHLSSLYAPPGMEDWEHWIRKYLAACPPGQKRDESKWQAFLNTVLAETYEEQGEAPEATALQKNIRPYEIDTVPESLSIADGNGPIVCLVCTADMNGTENDGRLDYEIVAWAESGAQYSVRHGSIGTFVLGEKQRKEKVEREIWTYAFEGDRSIWKKFTEIRKMIFRKDTTGKDMPVFFTGLDCGHLHNYAYLYLDYHSKATPFIVGIKGKNDSKISRFSVDFAFTSPSKERPNLHMVEVNRVKDELAGLINMPWNKEFSEKQPPGYLNYPTPSGGLYLLNNYFSHFEAEHKVQGFDSKGVDIGFIWKKKNAHVQNHCWDLKVYQLACKEIMVKMILKEYEKETGQKTGGTWYDLAQIILGKKV